NTLRLPSNIHPLHGSFGPPPTPHRLSSPTPSDFNTAFWVTALQNGIHQTWAPLYTMFSRGNIREKTRLLTLPSVRAAGAGCTAVDLYAGIGYFAFVYRKAGCGGVVCWELNPWSVEGLRRGAGLNGWSVKVVTSEQLGERSGDVVRRVEDARVDFLVFQEDNERALDVVGRLSSRGSKSAGPPVRHVNCGFLPSSWKSWGVAVKALDRELGGWIHAHENVGVGDIDKRAEEVVVEMQGLLDECAEDEVEQPRDGWKGRRTAICEHVERVKTYAPGVVHVVFDIRIEWAMERRTNGDRINS
ncbi:hypothetical protein P154DRAFT_452289, partial [Amniculicola lignicola CBS 123094]